MRMHLCSVDCEACPLEVLRESLSLEPSSTAVKPHLGGGLTIQLGVCMQKGPAEWYGMQESAVPRLVHGPGVIFLFSLLLDRSILVLYER